jgi:WD40 repeat protein
VLLALIGGACGGGGTAPLAATHTGRATGVPCTPAPAASLVLVPQGALHGAAIAQADDGGRLVVVDTDGSAQIWDPATGELRAEYAAARDADAAVDARRPMGSVPRSALRPDAHVLASITSPDHVALRDLATGAVESVRFPANTIDLVAWTGDGQWLAVAHSGGTDLVAAGGRRRRVEAFLGDVGALSADGTRMLGVDGSVWDTAQARLLWSMPREMGLLIFERGTAPWPASGYEYLSPDGRWVVCSTHRGVRIFDGTTGARRGELPVEGYTRYVRIDASGRYMVVSDGRSVHLFDLTALATIAKLPLGEDIAPEFSPDGSILAVIGKRSPDDERSLAASLFDPATGKLIRSVPLASARDVRWARGGHRLVILGSDEVHLVNADSGDAWTVPSLRRRPRKLSITDVAWSPDGGALALTTERDLGETRTESAVRVWDLRAGTSRASIEERRAVYHRAVWSPDGQLLALVRQDGIELWDGHSRDGVRRLDDDVKPGERFVAFSPDGHVLATAARGLGEVHIWDPTSGARLRTLPLGDDNPMSLAFHPDGQRLAIATSARHNGPRLRFVESDGGATLRIEPGRDEHPIREMHFAPRGQVLVTMSIAGRVELFRTGTDAPPETLARDLTRGSTSALSPDGNLLATGDRELRISDLRTGAVIRDVPSSSLGPALFDHVAADGGPEIRALRFGPGGENLAVARADHVVLYRISDGATVRLQLLEGHGEAVTLVEYTDAGLFAGDPEAFQLLRFRSDPVFGTAPLVRADQVRGLLRPALALDWARGCPLGTAR